MSPPRAKLSAVLISFHRGALGFLGLLIACGSVAYAAVATALDARADARAVAAAVESRYARSRTLQVTFLERYSQGKNVRIESGTAYFSRPGRMRWEYEAPEEKLFLVDGKNVWFYVPADRTATRAKVKESEDWHTPLALLAGRIRKGTFDRMCETLELLPTGAAIAGAPPAPSKGGHGGQKQGRQDAGGTEQQGRQDAGGTGYALRCVPEKDKAPFQEMHLETDANYRLRRLVIREAGGVETEFRFANWRENIALPEVMFHFAAPRGVAIVEEQSIAAPGP